MTKLYRPEPPYRLTFDDAVEVWLRLWRGEYQHRIAADFNVNQGRVNDVKMDRLHPGSREAALRLSGQSDRGAA